MLYIDWIIAAIEWLDLTDRFSTHSGDGSPVALSQHEPLLFTIDEDGAVTEWRFS